MKKYVFVIFALCASLLIAGCGDRHTTVVEQVPVQQAVIAQPVYVSNPDPMTGVLAGMAIGTIMSNGMRYDGHNGYYDNRYHGPSRTVVKNTTIINKTVVNNAPTPATPTPAVSKVSVPVAPIVPAAPVKVKNPGDAATEQARKNDALKAELKAKQAARASAPVKTGGFNSMSKGRR